MLRVLLLLPSNYLIARSKLETHVLVTWLLSHRFSELIQLRANNILNNHFLKKDDLFFCRFWVIYG